MPEIELSQRGKEIFQKDLSTIHLRTDRMFFWLLIGQWVAAIAIALIWSPQTWIAQYWSVHQHLIAAGFLGGLFAAYPLYLIKTQPGTPHTRHIIAIGQMLQSALLVHVTGGRIETHFHVFGSLALLAFYRDWLVLVTGAVVVYVNHLALGIFFPLSVYGVVSAPIWRSLEHAFWVIFEVVFLTMASRKGIQELRAIAEREVRLEDVAQELRGSHAEILRMSDALKETNRNLEARVQERTQQLRKAMDGLELIVQERTQELIQAKEGLETQVQDRTRELQGAKEKLEAKVRELELLTNVMMGREEQIISLKDKIKGLQDRISAA